MIVDSSAIVAVVLEEPGFEPVLDELASGAAAGVGTPTLAETAIVLCAKLGMEGRTVLARVVDEFELTAIPFGEEHWETAVEAYVRYGRGRHAAGLNFGDCLTYAVAWLADEPLLCLDRDLAKTDLTLVL